MIMKTKIKLLLSSLPLSVALGSTLLVSPAAAKPDTLYQVSTLQALALGVYDGPTTLGNLLKQGDFGLGTLNALDGEMLILDGKAWQVQSDGRVLLVPGEAKLPFAIATHFQADRRLKIVAPLEYSVLHQQLDKLLPTVNAPVAIRIRGHFSRLKVRSVPRQEKPYRPLAEVTKTQSVWEWENVRGTLVGFKFPQYLGGVNLADYHFHFLSDDRSRGGHVLDVAIESGSIELDSLRAFEMVLPDSAEFDRADLITDQKADLEKAEKG